MYSCASISQNTIKNDSLKISPEQVKKVYNGLVSAGIYKEKYNDCVLGSKKLDSVIAAQNMSLEFYIYSTNKNNEKIKELNEKLLNTKKPVPFYRSIVFLLFTGFTTGLLLMK